MRHKRPAFIAIIFAVTFALSLLSAETALAGDDMACAKYAKTAVAQNKENIQKDCGFKGPGWNSNYQGHFNWCMHGENAKHADRENTARQKSLQKCNITIEQKPGTPVPVIKSGKKSKPRKPSAKSMHELKISNPVVPATRVPKETIQEKTAQKPDLFVKKIKLSNVSPKAGDKVKIEAFVHNSGRQALKQVGVRFFVNGEKITDKHINISANKQGKAVIQFAVKSNEGLNIVVEADPDNKVDEKVEHNNKKTFNTVLKTADTKDVKTSQIKPKNSKLLKKKKTDILNKGLHPTKSKVGQLGLKKAGRTKRIRVHGGSECLFALLTDGWSGPGGGWNERIRQCVDKYGAKPPKSPANPTQVMARLGDCNKGQPIPRKYREWKRTSEAYAGIARLGGVTGNKKELYEMKSFAYIESALVQSRGGPNDFKETKDADGNTITTFKTGEKFITDKKGNVTKVIKLVKPKTPPAKKTPPATPDPKDKDKKKTTPSKKKPKTAKKKKGDSRPLGPGGDCDPYGQHARQIYDCVFGGSEAGMGASPDPLVNPGPMGLPPRMPGACNVVDVKRLFGSTGHGKGVTRPANPEDMIKGGPTIKKGFIQGKDGFTDPPKERKSDKK